MRKCCLEESKELIRSSTVGRSLRRFIYRSHSACTNNSSSRSKRCWSVCRISRALNTPACMNRLYAQSVKYWSSYEDQGHYCPLEFFEFASKRPTIYREAPSHPQPRQFRTCKYRINNISFQEVIYHSKPSKQSAAKHTQPGLHFGQYRVSPVYYSLYDHII